MMHKLTLHWLVWLGASGVHLMSAFLANPALRHLAVSGGSEHFDPFKGSPGGDFVGVRSDTYDRVQPFMLFGSCWEAQGHVYKYHGRWRA